MITVTLFRGEDPRKPEIYRTAYTTVTLEPKLNRKRKGKFNKSFNSIEELVNYLVHAKNVYLYSSNGRIADGLTSEQQRVFSKKYRTFDRKIRLTKL